MMSKEQKREEVVLVVTFTEGEVGDVYEHATREEASAFCYGFGRGASAYGAGSAYGLVWPPRLEDDHEPDDVEAAREVMMRWRKENPHKVIDGCRGQVGVADMDEGYCAVREDGSHCAHWWDGDRPCCSCEAGASWRERNPGTEIVDE